MRSGSEAASDRARSVPTASQVDVLASYYAEAGRLVLARDPFGIKPLYYTPTNTASGATNGTLRFASQVKALLTSIHVSREPDPAGGAVRRRDLRPVVGDAQSPRHVGVARRRDAHRPDLGPDRRRGVARHGAGKDQVGVGVHLGLPAGLDDGGGVVLDDQRAGVDRDDRLSIAGLRREVDRAVVGGSGFGVDGARGDAHSGDQQGRCGGELLEEHARFPRSGSF